MKISEMIDVLQDVMKRTGDVEMQGVCWNCTKDDLGITVLEDASNNYVAISLSDEEDEDEDEENEEYE